MALTYMKVKREKQNNHTSYSANPDDNWISMTRYCIKAVYPATQAMCGWATKQDQKSCFTEKQTQQVKQLPSFIHKPDEVFGFIFKARSGFII